MQTRGATVARDDPFAGMKLSELPASGKLDQRLFTREATPTLKSTPAAPKPVSATSQSSPAIEVGQIRASKSAVVQAKKTIVAPVGERFDLKDEALYKATFVFTQEELEALEDLKLELRRDLNRKVTKYDLVRAALHLLFEDHAANRENSHASRKLKKR